MKVQYAANIFAVTHSELNSIWMRAIQALVSFFWKKSVGEIIYGRKIIDEQMMQLAIGSEELWFLFCFFMYVLAGDVLMFLWRGKK